MEPVLDLGRIGCGQGEARGGPKGGPESYDWHWVGVSCIWLMMSDEPELLVAVTTTHDISNHVQISSLSDAALNLQPVRDR